MRCLSTGRMCCLACLKVRLSDRGHREIIISFNVNRIVRLCYYLVVPYCFHCSYSSQSFCVERHGRPLLVAANESMNLAVLAIACNKLKQIRHRREKQPLCRLDASSCRVYRKNHGTQGARNDMKVVVDSEISNAIRNTMNESNSAGRWAH